MSLRVFLVDDIPPLRAALAELLPSIGDFRIVAEYANEAEARDWLLHNPDGFDIAIVDLILEQGTGMGVVAKAREVSATARIAVFSDYVTPGVRSHCLQLGADAVFQKSDELDALMQWCSGLSAA